MSDEKNIVEVPAIEKLTELGWMHRGGSKLSPDKSIERKSLKEVVLEGRLKDSLKRLNPWINEDNLAKVIRDLTKTPHTSLIEANQSIWSQVNHFVSVKQDVGKGNKGQTVRIIDFESIDNNDFLCVDQFVVQGTNEKIIPDIVCFVNGLPLAVIECKSPYITDPISEGINQLLRYANQRNPADQEGAERLFHYNSMMVVTTRDKARVGTISSRVENFLEWKDPYPLTKDDLSEKCIGQEILLAGLFSRKNFLDVLRNFTVFEAVEGRTIKKIPRYQQFRAVHKSLERIKSGKTRKDKSGVIWHTQGSGKSLTMVFLCVKVRRDPELRYCKLVFLTDRTQLDSQITSTLQRTQDETVIHAKSVKHLRELLAKDASDLVTATVQKFQTESDNFDFPVLNESEKIIILTDEAHRTQYGTLGAAINTSLPNAPRIAFTGTPLIKSQKTTNAFGSYIDTYTIDQSVQDGATVQIMYEGREAQLNVAGENLDQLFNDYFSEYTDEQKHQIKRKHGTQRAILESPNRIQRVCMDIVKHYSDFIRPNGFKAMIVTSSRRAAITYKEQLDKLNAPPSAVVISGDHNDEQIFKNYTNPSQHKLQIDDFLKPHGYDEGQSDLSFLIVKDMLLTGFDAPIAQVMYLDTKIVDHSLLQAIARVNRTKKNKFKGYIIDYYGLSDYLAEALDMFSSKDIQGALIELKEEIPHLKNAHTKVLNHFTGTGVSNTDQCIEMLENEENRQNFHRDFRTFSRQMDIVLPNEAATAFIKDLKQLGRISIGAKNLYRDEQLEIEGVGQKVRKLIEQNVCSLGIDPKIPPIDLLAHNYKEKLRDLKSPRAQASELRHAISHHIRINEDEDPVYYKKLSEQLEQIIQKHEEKWDDLVQRLLDFRENIESGYERQANELGVTKDEFPVYNAIVDSIDEKDLDKYPKETIREVVKSIVEIIDKATQIVDFHKKPDEQKLVIRDIKRIVIEKLDISLVKPITEKIMDLLKGNNK